MTPADLKWTDRDEESLRAFIDFDRHVTAALAQTIADRTDPTRVSPEEWAVLIVLDDPDEAEEGAVSVKGLGFLFLLFLFLNILLWGGLSVLAYVLGGWPAVGITWGSIFALMTAAHFLNGGR